VEVKHPRSKFDGRSDEMLRSSLRQAAEAGNLADVTKLVHDLHVPADALPRGCTSTALMTALAHGHYRCAAALVAAGADVNRYISGGGGNSLTLHVTRGDVAQVKWLLDHGADPTVRVRDPGYAYYDKRLEEVAGVDEYAQLRSRETIQALLRAALPWFKRRVAVIAFCLSRDE